MNGFRVHLLKFLDSTLGALLCRVLNLALAIGKPPNPGPDPNPATIRRILVIRPGGMGDMILLLPAIRALREAFPWAEICLACEKRNIGILPLTGLELSNLVYDARPLSFLRALRRPGFDLAIDTEQFHHFSAVFAFLSRAPIRIGFKINPIRNPLYTHLINYAPDGPEVLQFLSLLEPLSVSPAAGAMTPALPAEAEEPAGLRERLAPLGGVPFVAVHAGSRHPYKAWDPSSFAELAKRFRAECGLATVLVGSADERPEADAAMRLAAGPEASPLSAVGLASLPETAALIRRARLFVGTDSGLSHLAAAVGTPTVVLFGPSDPAKWGWTGPRHAVVRKALPCSPCFIFGYHRPCGTVACMKRIGVEEVFQACAGVLRVGPTGT